jgi:two-component system, LytTR family, response regulator
MMTQPTYGALIVEDEPLGRRRLRELIRGVPWLDCVGEASNGPTAVAAIDEFHPDLVFLDIRLPGCSGLEVLARISHLPAVIFTTAHDSFAVSAFELGALDYLLKPFGQDRFAKALARARASLDREAEPTTAERASEVLSKGAVRRLFVQDAGRIVPIRVESIESLEACDDYVIVHAGSRQYRVNLSLANVESRLDPRTFVRVHRSHAINLDHVLSLTPYDGSRFQVTLRSGRILTASRQQSRALRDLAR